MATNLDIKEQLYNLCLKFIDNRYQAVFKTLKEIKESLLSETKSSAGDKHETGRAMLQLEREKTGQQLAEVQKVKEILTKIDVGKSSKAICLGSLVYTSAANYFIAISAGELTISNQKFFAISPSTPIGQLLLSKTEGDTVIFRDQSITIKTVL